MWDLKDSCLVNCLLKVGGKREVLNVEIVNS